MRNGPSSFLGSVFWVRVGFFFSELVFFFRVALFSPSSSLQGRRTLNRKRLIVLETSSRRALHINVENFYAIVQHPRRDTRPPYIKAGQKWAGYECDQSEMSRWTTAASMSAAASAWPLLLAKASGVVPDLRRECHQVRAWYQSKIGKERGMLSPGGPCSGRRRHRSTTWARPRSRHQRP